jgi:hypothetical protein
VRQDDVHLAAHEFRHHGVIVRVENAFAIVDPDVFAIDVSELGQSLFEHVEPLGIRAFGSRVAQARRRLSGALRNGPE